MTVVQCHRMPIDEGTTTLAVSVVTAVTAVTAITAITAVAVKVLNHHRHSIVGHLLARR